MAPASQIWARLRARPAFAAVSRANVFVKQKWARLQARPPFAQVSQANVFVKQKWAILQARPPFAQVSQANAFLKQKWAKTEQATPVYIKALSRYLWTTCQWIPVFIFFRNYVFDLTKIRGPSMSPLFNERHNETTTGDLCLTRVFQAQEGLERGMIVTFYNPLIPDCLTTKRIIALPGELVPFKDSVIRVPPHHVWVEGDGGKELSRDSNTYGPISIRLIQGRITHILWPFYKAGKIKWWEHPDRLAAFRE